MRLSTDLLDTDPSQPTRAASDGAALASVTAGSHRRPFARIGLLIGVCAFLFVAPLAVRQPNSYDGVAMERVAVGLADHLNPLVSQVPDQFKLNTPYSTYGLATSVVMAPLAAVGRATGTDPTIWMNLANALIVGATCVVVFETLRRRGVSQRIATTTTALVLMGTPLLAYALTDFSEPGVALMIAIAVLGLDGESRRTRYAASGVGAAVGGSILFRTDSVVLIALPVAAALMVLSRRKTRAAVLFALGAAPSMCVWAWYNAARYGNPLAGGYRHQHFTHSFLRGAYGLTLSPGRGVLVYIPLLIIAFAVIPTLRRTDLTLGVLAIALLGLRVAFYARWWAWYGGSIWGPRFLVPVVPAFAPAIAAALQRWQARPAWIAPVVLASVAISATGVWLTPHWEHNPYFLREPQVRGGAQRIMAHVTDPAYVRDVDDTLFDWSVFPFR